MKKKQRGDLEHLIFPADGGWAFKVNKQLRAGKKRALDAVH